MTNSSTPFHIRMAGSLSSYSTTNSLSPYQQDPREIARNLELALSVGAAFTLRTIQLDMDLAEMVDDEVERRCRVRPHLRTTYQQIADAGTGRFATFSNRVVSDSFDALFQR